MTVIIFLSELDRDDSFMIHFKPFLKEEVLPLHSLLHLLLA